MSRVVLAWELGGNQGHLGRLLRLAHAFVEAGHELTFITKDVDATRLAVVSGSGRWQCWPD
jgi:hypothetical protein